MALKIEGLAKDGEINETLEPGQTKAYPLGMEETVAVPVFGVETETGEHLWNIANPQDAFVHIDGRPTSNLQGEVKNQSVRIGSYLHRDRYVKATRSK